MLQATELGGDAIGGAKDGSEVALRGASLGVRWEVVLGRHAWEEVRICGARRGRRKAEAIDVGRADGARIGL